jgi:hypothetical protein
MVDHCRDRRFAALAITRFIARRPDVRICPHAVALLGGVVPECTRAPDCLRVAALGGTVADV